ncbi:MAG TPA: filamentous hemagglutinin N-terminal domain-containing protein [Acetobacteraceae bacterium]|nr:filamentous hemagglutinin N-terminal domain-containing protein [Acetobacteraceae bacterium]
MAKARHTGQAKLLGVIRRPRPALLVTTALCATVVVVVALPAQAQPPNNALPTGGSVFGGSASISTSGNTTTISQASQRAAINWQTFNIGSQAQVQFNQPNAAAVALNRVTTPNPSQIAGRLDANGQVIIENQSGVIFYKGSQVNTAGLMVSAASSSDAATRAFLNSGKLVTDLPANPNASVINQGHITVRQAGLAALVAPQVRNDGVIVARLGHVVLASGTETTLDLYGDGLMSIDVSGLVKTLPNGAKALVTNTGTIIADGGTVQLTAREADGIVQTLVDAGGKIRANTIGNHVGKITLAGVGGDITIEGQLQANGAKPGTTGGNIVVNPSGNVNVASTARISASGQAGGGVIALGTTLKRAKDGPTVTATHTSAGIYVAPGALIAANATGNGNGGRVTVLSSLTDGTTVMNGTISADGGPLGGNGGFIETSGHWLAMANTGLVTAGALAPGGRPGTWLLDPVDINITGGTTDTTISNSSGTFQASNANTANIFNGDIQNALGTSNVLITTTCGGSTCNAPDLGTITDSALITWDTANTLTFSADNNIIINRGAAIIGAAGTLILSAGNTTPTGSITIGAPIDVANFTASSNTAGAITVNDVVIANGSISIAAGTGGITLGADLGSSNTQLTNLSSGGTIAQTAGSITSQQLEITAAGPVSLPGANAVEMLAAQVTGSGSGFAFNNTGTPLTVGTVGAVAGIATNGGAIALSTTTSGDLTLAGDLTATGQPVSLISAGTISQTSGSITAGMLTGSAVGSAQLTDSNDIATLGNFTVADGDDSGSNFDLVNAGSIGVAGTVGADNVTIDAGAIGVSGTILAPNGFISLASTSGAIGLTSAALLDGNLVGLTSNTSITEAATSTLVASSLNAIATNGSIVLGSTLNQIASMTGATAAGDVTIVSGEGMLLTGFYSGTNLLFESTGSTGTLRLAEGENSATLDAPGGTISLLAGTIEENPGALIESSVVEIAPSTGMGVTLNGTQGAGGLVIDSTLLGDIDASLLRVGRAAGTTTATGITLANALNTGTIVLELDSTGAVVATGTAALTVPTLTGTAGNGFTLIASGDAIGTLGLLDATAGNVLVTDATPLTVAGTVSVSSTGTLLLNAGSIALAGGGVLNDPTGTVDLSTTTSGITETGGSIVAAVLQSSSNVAGPATLGDTNNIGTLAGFVVNGGSLLLADGNSDDLHVTGSVFAAGVTLVAGAITTANSIVSTGSLGLTATAAGISIGSLVSAGGTLDLSATSGNVAEVNGGTIVAATVFSNLGVGQGATLLNGNSIGALGAFSAGTGDFLLIDDQSLSIAGAVSAAGDIFVKDAASGGITLAAGGALAATGTQPLIELVANQFALNTGFGTISAVNGTVAIAPLSGGTLVSLAGSTSNTGTLLIPGNLLADINAGNGTLQIGSYADFVNGGAGTVTAGAISVDGPVNLGGVAATLRLDSIGGVTESGTNAITVGTLVGNAGSTVSLTNNNAIGALGSFDVANGNFVLNDPNITGSLAVVGLVSATTVDLSAANAGIQESGNGAIDAATLQSSGGAGGNVDLGGGNAIGTLGNFTLSAGTFHLSNSGSLSGMNVTGSVIASSVTLDGLSGTLAISNTVSATSGLVSITDTGTGGNIALNNGAYVSGPTIDLTSGSIALNGNAFLGNSTAVLDLTTTGTGGVGEASAATILAALLQSSGGIANSVSLGSAGNTIAAIGSLAESAGTFSLTDKGNLSVGTLTAPGIGIADNNGTITIANRLIATNTVSLSATTILIQGEASDGGTGTTTLLANGGSILETGTLIAGTLSGSASAIANFAGTSNAGVFANRIGSIASFSASGFVLNDGTALAIGSVSGETFASITAAGLLSVNTLISAGTIDLQGTGIQIPGEVNAGPTGPVSLIATNGSINETGTLIAGMLSGSAQAGANLSGSLNGTAFANQVGTLGNFSAAGFVLDNGTALTVTGIVNGGSSVAIDSSQLLSITGSVIGSDLMNLTGSAIAITGAALVSDGGRGTTDLSAANGTIFENATMLIGTLNGTAAASASFSGNNTIANVGSFGAGGFILNDGTTALNVGTINGGTLASIDVAGTLTIASLVSASAVDLTATTILIPGTVNATPSGAMDLIANGGSINETGALIAADLSGSATGVANLAGATTTANQIGTITSFTSNGFALNDGTNLTIDTIAGTSFATVLDAGSLSVNGILSAGSISLTAGSIQIPGEATAGTTGTIELAGTSGPIIETGTLIAGTLSGTSAAIADLAGATVDTNQILNIGSFGSSGLVLNDGTALTASAVNGNSSVSIDVAGTLTVTTLLSGNAIDLAATSIDIPGTVTAGTTGTVTMVANPGSITETGLLTAGMLSGSSTGTTDLANAMIGTLGGFSAAAFTLNDGTGLTVAAPVIATSGAVTIADTGSLTNNSTIQAATAATVSATGNLANNGSVDANGGNAVLAAGNGMLTNGGLIQASANTTLTAVMSLANTGSVLANGGNALLTASNGAVTNGGLIQASTDATLMAGTGLTNTGSVIATSGNALLAANNGTLSSSGLVLAGANTTLQSSGAMTLAGVVNTADSTTLNSGGAITQNGSFLSPVLAGSAASTVSLLGATPTANQVGMLTNFTAGGFTLDDGEALTVSGVVNGGPSVTVNDAVAVTVNGSIVSASVMSLTGSAITINGFVTDGGSGTTSLTATGGAITEGGTLIAGTLSGSATDAAGLTGATASANQIANLSTFSATSLTLLDGAGLTVVGPVTATTGAISVATQGALTNRSLVQAATSATLTAATAATNTGSIIAQSGNAVVTAASGTLTNGGLILASLNATVSGDAGFTNTGSIVATAGAASIAAANGAFANSGLIQASSGATLSGASGANTGSGSIIVQAGGASLTATSGTLTNAGQVVAHTSVTMQSAGDLTTTGLIAAQGGDASLTSTGGQITTGGIVLASDNAMLQAASNLTNSGSIVAQSGSASLTAFAGTLMNSGLIQAVTGATLSGASGANTGSGSIIVQAGSAALTATSGMLTNAGQVVAHTSVTMQSAGDLTTTGLIAAQGGDASLTSTGGQITTGGIVLASDNATLQAASNLTNSGSIVAQTGSASLTASAGVLSNSGLVQAATNATLQAAAGLNNTNTGSIIAQAGNASLTASTGTLFNSGLISAGGTLSVTAANGPIVQAGAGASMVAGAVVVTNASGGISLDGLVKDDTGIVLNSGGNITQDGILIADLLTGSAAGTVNLLGASPASNQVATLGSFTSSGAFALNDGISLTIAGPVTVNGVGSSFSLNDVANVTINNIIVASRLLITTPATIFLGNGGLVTGGVPNGTPLPLKSLSTNELPFLGNAPYMGVSQGAWLKASNVIQTGNAFTVANFSGTAESVLLIDLTPNSTASMLHLAGGLMAPTTWAIFDVGAGQANGSFNVQRLDFLYTQPPGLASFTNATVGGDTGFAAAGTSFIQPLPNANYRVNGCPIHSVNCTILTTLSLPTANPLNDIIIGSPSNSQNQGDLVLPVVSDERYELMPCANPNPQGVCDETKRPEQ